MMAYRISVRLLFWTYFPIACYFASDHNWRGMAYCFGVSLVALIFLW